MKKPMYFVATHPGKITVQRPDDTIREFPLTENGCREAGAFLRDECQEEWLCSSTVDFPEEENPGFNCDIHALMLEGLNSEKD